MMHNLFVYGTLKLGYSNHHILKDSTFIKDHVLTSSCFMVDLGPYPAAIYDPRKDAKYKIKGELYYVNNKTLESTDWLEGYPDYYTRTLVHDDATDMWIYHFIFEEWNRHMRNESKYPIITEWYGRKLYAS